MATAKEIQHEITRILDQGAEAVNQVILAYIEKRTPERDLNWLCLQMGKEFGAAVNGLPDDCCLSIRPLSGSTLRRHPVHRPAP